MRGRWPLLVMLGSAVVFVVSLFLPWRHSPTGVFTSTDGWSADAGYAAALVAIALAWAAGASLLRPSFAARLPLGGLGIALAYFAYGATAQLQPSIDVPSLGEAGHGSWAYGGYLGLAMATLAGLAALGLRREQLLRRRSAGELAEISLGLGLVVLFLLPWMKLDGFHRIGLESSPAVIAAAWLMVGAGQWLGGPGGPRVRLAAAAITAVLTGAAATALEFSADATNARWVAIGCAVALVVLEAARARGSIRLPQAPDLWTTLRAGGALLLLVSLFLPWVEFGPPQHAESMNGWQTSFGALAGTLALVVLAAPVLTWAAAYALENVLGIALLVTTLGVLTTYYPGSLRYGSYAGLVAGALLLIGTLGLLRWRQVDRRRAAVRTAPIVASLACVAAVVVPVWQGVLPETWTIQALAVRGWFWSAALLLALHLLLLWVEQIRRASPSPSLVLTPLLLLPLPALLLIAERGFGVVWGGVILIGLCLVLAVLGWIERDRGLENVGGRIPEILRVDRLPGAET